MMVLKRGGKAKNAHCLPSLGEAAGRRGTGPTGSQFSNSLELTFLGNIKAEPLHPHHDALLYTFWPHVL